MKNKKGFTLVELLVVVAIIGILAAISVVALNTARARARDSRRVADVRQIQTALELYYNDWGTYPDSVTAGGAIASGTNVYMSTVPTPPTPYDGSHCSAANNYTYAVSGGGTAVASYTITYCLGSNTGGLEGKVSTATPATVQVK